MGMKELRRKKDIAITGGMARWYDKSSKARLGEFHKVADTISANVKEKAKILEVAPGPGYLSIELARRGFDVTGVELSADFVGIEKRNAAQANVTVDFKQGNASLLPLPDDTFDFLVCSAAFKNFSEPQKALDEMRRVLKTGGVALVIDMNREASNSDIAEEMREMENLSAFDRLFIKLSFRTTLRKGAYSRREFEEFAARTEFSRHEITQRGIGFQLWLYK
jgi:ubiquinone/menaquinone biosynthesis C-methylase UbiE